ncbi:MAG: ABC transporter ATP-binding protein [Planctomycetia bacterium]
MIRVENLQKSYVGVRALDGVTFDIPQGQVVGLLGPNGAGKTTMMRILTGFVAPTGGQAWVDGIDVQDDPVACQRRIGYLPEGNPLYTDLRVREALAFAAEMQGLRGAAARAAIAEAVEQVGLADVVHRTIGTFSKGYRQRVGLAQALLHRPPVLILDEPTTGLDPNQQQDMRDLIRRLGQERTVVLSTHILPEVEAVCQRALIIAKGRLVADGTIDEVRAQGRGEACALLTVRGTLEQARAAFAHLAFVAGVTEGAAPAPGLRALRVALAGHADADRLEALAAACHAARLPLSRLEPKAARLEDVFAVLTEQAPATTMEVA